MIPVMTFPDFPEEEPRRTAVVPLGGENFTIRQLTDAQAMHLGRYAQILISDNVERDPKLQAMNRMLAILHSALVDQGQLERLIEMEEEGKVTLKELLVFDRKFREEEEAAAAPVVVRRRGRPRKSA